MRSPAAVEERGGVAATYSGLQHCHEGATSGGALCQRATPPAGTQLHKQACGVCERRSKNICGITKLKCKLYTILLRRVSAAAVFRSGQNSGSLLVSWQFRIHHTGVPEGSSYFDITPVP